MTAESASCIFFGDVFLKDVPDGALFSEELSDYTRRHELRIVNFEGPVAPEGTPSEKRAGVRLLQHPLAPKCVLDAGFNVISLANNHMMDYGSAGLRATLDAFSAVRTLGAGLTAAEAFKPYIVTVNGVKLAFLSLTERQFGTIVAHEGAGTAWIMDPTLTDEIRQLASVAHHVVILAHAGLENEHTPLPEWRAVYRRFIDEGASAVIASHPHVRQGFEAYGDGIIVYSLGNAAWREEHAVQKRNLSSLVASVTFGKHERPVLNVRPVVYADGCIRFDETEEAENEIRRFCGVLADRSAYRRECGRMTAAFYADTVLNDFFCVTGALPGGRFQQLKNGAKLVLCERALNIPLLASMLENETYRWAAAAGMRQKDAHCMNPSEEELWRT